MPVRFQQRCVKCRKNMVPMYSAKQFPICADCEMREWNQPITNKAMAKFFDLPEAHYRQSSFLRSIKSQYLKFGRITDKQRDAFLNVVDELKQPGKPRVAKAAVPADTDDAPLRAKLVDALTHLLVKDTKARRRDVLELLEDLQAQPVTHAHLKRALDKLMAPVRGRPRFLIMTTEEVNQVLQDLAGAP